MKTFKDILTESNKMTTKELVDYLNKNHLPSSSLIGYNEGEKPYYDIFYTSMLNLVSIGRAPASGWTKSFNKDIEKKWSQFLKEKNKVITKLGFKIKKSYVYGDEKDWVNIEWVLDLSKEDI